MSLPPVATPQNPCFYCRRGMHDSCISGPVPCRCCAVTTEADHLTETEQGAARLLLEFAGYDDDLGWSPSVDVGENADELAAFLVGHGVRLQHVYPPGQRDGEAGA